MVAGHRPTARECGRQELDDFMEEVFGGALHAQRLASLTDGVDGVLHAASLGIRAIGQGLAAAQGLAPRHAIKQVDRLLSNPKLSMAEVWGCWVPFMVGERREIYVNFDWTEFIEADQSMVVLGMHTGHGRSTPLLWKTVTRSALLGQRNAHEDALLGQLAAVVPPAVRVTVVADRGFADHKLYRFLTEDLRFDYIIRCRGDVYVANAAGEVRQAKAWLGPGGRMRVLRQADVTRQRQPVSVVVCVQDPGMQEAWYLVSSRGDLTGSTLKAAYGRRFTVEETFRDVKNARLGLGLTQVSIVRNDRRDALFLLAALAHTLLTLLGKAGQELGMERMLGATRPKQLSLFRQGLMLFELIPTMRADRLRALVQKFGELLQEHVLFTGLLGVL